MKKYIHSLMALLAIVSIASCSSEGNETMDNTGNTKVMTFSATQEGEAPASRAAISADDSKVINWEANDQISIFDGTANNQFTLKEGAGTTSAKFEGTAASADNYIAVYPYQSEATLSGTSVENVTLPATQTATAGSFDKTAALMMAQSSTTSLAFKNAVGYVKVTPNFDCSKIELKAAGASDYLAGKGTLTYNEGAPSIAITSDQSATITLEGSIISGNAYYIAVPATTLSAGWSISFTATDSKVYTRKGSNAITFKHNTVTNLGEFATDGTYWYTPRGIVSENQEVDMGLTITKDGKNYKVIFAKSNLTANGLAENESDFGDYFAWAATEPWYISYTLTNGKPTVSTGNWKTGKTDGYYEANAPYYNGTKYTANSVLDPSDDAARQILGGEWQLPTKEIWQALYNTTKYTWSWTAQNGNNGRKVVNETTESTLFLPAAGYFYYMSSNYVGSFGFYWSGTAYSSTSAYYLEFNNGKVGPHYYRLRYAGFSVRPVRLVPVTE